MHCALLCVLRVLCVIVHAACIVRYCACCVHCALLCVLRALCVLRTLCVIVRAACIARVSLFLCPVLLLHFCYLARLWHALVDWLTHALADWLTHALADWLTHALADWLTHALADSLHFCASLPASLLSSLVCALHMLLCPLVHVPHASGRPCPAQPAWLLVMLAALGLRIHHSQSSTVTQGGIQSQKSKNEYRISVLIINRNDFESVAAHTSGS